MNRNHLLGLAVAASASLAQAGWVDGERGIKFLNERLTLNPYVALSYTYDSNVDSSKHSQSGSQWVVNPGANATYAGDRFSVDANVFYRYHAYNRYTRQLNSSSFGESLKFKYDDVGAEMKGWRISFSEDFEQIAQNDDMSSTSGRGIGRDRKQFQAEVDANRRFGQHVHASLQADCYYLDYDNNVKKYAPMYGWSRMTIGGQLGYTASKWSDILLSASYHTYEQDNGRNKDRPFRAEGENTKGRHISSDSEGWSVMAGLGTHATEKISYKVMAGWSHFGYGGGAENVNGWTYRASANWQVDEKNTFNVMLLGASYYQPSERSYGSAVKVYTASLGARKSLVRNKLHATGDFCYRREAHEYAEYAADGYDQDIFTFRVGLTYDINRLLSVYGRLEYVTEESDGHYVRGHRYDYDRIRGTVGLRLTY